MNAITDHSLQHKILTEQVRMLYQSMISILLINLLVSAGLVYGLWDVVDHTTLTVWMGLMLIMLLARAIIYFFYRHQFTPEHVKRYSLFLTIGSGAAGLIWGIGGVVMMPVDNLEYQLFLLFFLLGMGSGSTSSLYIYLPAFFAFFPVLMLPAAIRLLMFNDPLHLSLGMMTIVYTVAISFFNIRINKGLKTSLSLRFENIDLVEKLREQKAEADNANQAKSKFLAAASHDLRQPLYALSLFTSVLDESIQYPKVRRVVDQIKASVGSLQNLFNALLDISQLDAGVMKAEKTDFSTQPLFKKMANDFNTQAHEKGLTIVWPVDHVAIHSDQNLLEQILSNYISNAIRYTQSGEILVHCATDNNQVTISVSDTGIGIPEAEQQIIFEEFQQLSNPERDRGKGLGLGLAIVLRTAKLLGHEIHLESHPGTGSTFSVTVDKAYSTKYRDVEQAETEPEQIADARLLILVIDDEASVREGTQSLLQVWGCDVIAATSEADALSQLRQQQRTPDGIIADFRLRENRTGIQAIHAIHAEYNQAIPAVIVTGDIAPEHLQKVNESGFQLLHKPVAALKLRTFLRHLQRH